MTDKIAATPGKMIGTPWHRSLTSGFVGKTPARGIATDAGLNVAWVSGHPIDTDAVMGAILTAVNAHDELVRLLAVMFDAYENGPSCYEDPEECGGFLGHVVDLREEDFSAIADLLNRLDPKPADMPLPRQRSVEE